MERGKRKKMKRMEREKIGKDEKLKGKGEGGLERKCEK